ncbi:glycosyltransferase [Arenicella sp. 4NH20-0111]|uniref:glycosyltransferase family 2 protein n=1 Tax=Arenicella sp. 4NH20-0111 TaxID=3127648 RepID=UPI0031055855
MIVTVIIPTYNRERTLARALESVLSQKLPDSVSGLDVIVVDDGSTDNTQRLIQAKYPAVRYFYQTNRGVSAARNKGLAVSRGEWVTLLDSDDEWLPQKLIRQFEKIKDSGRLVCHTEERWVRNGLRVNQMTKHQKNGGHIFEKCLPLCAMSPSSIAIHKSIFSHVGDFDERLPACEDYDLWLRITAHYPVAYVETPSIIKYGGHEDQLSRAHWGMDRFRVQSLAKLLRADSSLLKITSQQRESTIKILRKKVNILMKGAEKHRNVDLLSHCEELVQEFEL